MPSLDLNPKTHLHENWAFQRQCQNQNKDQTQIRFIASISREITPEFWFWSNKQFKVSVFFWGLAQVCSNPERDPRLWVFGLHRYKKWRQRGRRFFPWLVFSLWGLSPSTIKQQENTSNLEESTQVLTFFLLLSSLTAPLTASTPVQQQPPSYPIWHNLWWLWRNLCWRGVT